MRSSRVVLREVTLPASLKYIGRQSFPGMDSVTLSSDNMPYGIAEAITSNTIPDNSPIYIKIKKPAATVFMPRYIVTADAVTLDTRLAIPSFRENAKNYYMIMECSRKSSGRLR